MRFPEGHFFFETRFTDVKSGSRKIAESISWYDCSMRGCRYYVEFCNLYFNEQMYIQSADVASSTWAIECEIRSISGIELIDAWLSGSMWGLIINTLKYINNNDAIAQSEKPGRMGWNNEMMRINYWLMKIRRDVQMVLMSFWTEITEEHPC